MKKIKLYRYIGKNGIITTPILLEGTKVYEMFTLIASEGKVLTDGEKFDLIKKAPFEEEKFSYENNAEENI